MMQNLYCSNEAASSSCYSCPSGRFVGSGVSLLNGGGSQAFNSAD